jgi:hypothetical protein
VRDRRVTYADLIATDNFRVNLVADVSVKVETGLTNRSLVYPSVEL